MKLLLTLALVLTLLWPVLLGVLRLYPPTSTLARRLLPVALLPALVVVIMPAGQIVLELPGVLLDSSIIRDDIARLFLLLIVLLLTPLLALTSAASELTDRDGLFDSLLLLFIVGLLTLVLSGGVLLFFTAGTVAGYALYGMLMSHTSTAGRRAGRVLVVLLVISDLLIFELLLLLSSQGLNFELLRQSLATMGGDHSVLLTLMLMGFGAKAGLLGLHFWLAPVWLSARPQLRPAILAFMLCAGLLAIIRLLPLGQLHWAGAGQLLQWLALAMSAYALLSGLLQTRQAAAWAYVVMLSTSVWLVVAGMLLMQPALFVELAAVWHIVLLQSVLALAVLAMLGQYRAPLLLCRVAVLNLAVAMLLLMSAVPVSGTVTLMPIYGAGAAVVMLAVATLRRQRPLSTAISWRTNTVAWLWLLSGLLLVPVFLLISGVQLSYSALWPAMLWLLAAAAAGSLRGASARGRVMPPGDLLLIIRAALSRLVSAGRWLGEVVLPRWRDDVLAWLRQSWRQLDQQAVWQPVALLLARWEIAIFLLLVIGLLIAVLSK